MHILLDATEVLEVMRNAEIASNGLYKLRIPASRIVQYEDEQQDFVFLDRAHSVSCGMSSVRLSPTQYFLLRFLYYRKQATYQEVQDAIWNGNASDGAIRAVVSKINSKMASAGIRMELVCFHGKVELEIIA